jgi:hypothetical protein
MKYASDSGKPQHFDRNLPRRRKLFSLSDEPSGLDETQKKKEKKKVLENYDKHFETGCWFFKFHNQRHLHSRPSVSVSSRFSAKCDFIPHSSLMVLASSGGDRNKAQRQIPVGICSSVISS